VTTTITTTTTTPIPAPPARDTATFTRAAADSALRLRHGAWRGWCGRSYVRSFTENFSEVPKNLKSPFTVNQPVIPNKKPIQQYNSLSTPKLTKKTSGISTNEISPRTSEKFFLNTVSKKSDQLKTNQPLPLTANQEQNPTKKELILLQKIQVLEKENNNLKQLVQQEKELSAKQKQRADNYQQQLTVIVNALKQWQKINYYKQLEKELKAQIEQPLFKLPNK